MSMATPSSPSARRSLAFPPEILLHILSFASNSYTRNYYTVLNHRNADLAALALVSRAFQAATYSVLYGDLCLAWMGDKVKRLRRSFSDNPQLLPLVRRLEATAVDVDEWVECQLGYPSDSDGEADEHRHFLDDYCTRSNFEKDSLSWREVMEGSLEGTDAKDEWFEWRTGVFEERWDEEGRGTWEGEDNRDGVPELLDLIGSAPALRSLVVREFDTDTLPATKVAKRGPYPLLESLYIPNESPFIAEHNLHSLLVSWAPNLRSLSGDMPRVETRSTLVPLPPSLTRLEITSFGHDDPQIDTLLLHAQPSLRSLTLVSPKPGWASSSTIMALLPSLETFIAQDPQLHKHQEDINSLARAIADSSLHHLEGVPATANAILIAALPPSLRSISLFHSMDSGAYSGSETEDEDSGSEMEAGDLGLEMEKVLEFMKAAAIQPLQVEFVTPVWRFEEGRVAWKEWREAYAVEGHVLSQRYWYQRLSASPDGNVRM